MKKMMKGIWNTTQLQYTLLRSKVSLLKKFICQMNYSITIVITILKTFLKYDILYAQTVET